MDETIEETLFDKLSKLIKDNKDYGYVLTNDELTILQNKINLLNEENIRLKTENLKFEKSKKLIDGLLLLPSKNLETKIEFKNDINNITFLIDVKLVNNNDNPVSNYIPLFSIVSSDNLRHITLGLFNNKIRIDDNYGCLYYSKNECKISNSWSSIFGILQLSTDNINVMIEYNNNKVLLNKFEKKNTEELDNICNLKEWKLIVGYTPAICKNNEIINVMFKKCIIVKDKLTFDEINNLDYETIKNSIYIDF
jgi:hypothetical protein